MADSAPRAEFAFSPLQWGVAAVIAAVLAFAFRDTISFIYVNWHREEFSHGFLIPLVTLFLIWQRRRQIQQLPFEASWVGVATVVFGLVLFVVAETAAVATLDTYALVLVVSGLLLAVMGWKAFRVVLPAVALLFLMVPIPEFLFSRMSSALQLVSSQIGVAVIRLFGISVHLQGNVIDLGIYKLQVVEACSGLRYLFPLFTLGVILASVIRMPTWIRLVMVFSTIPITILMNSFRIGVIGVLVEHHGIEQAEGFLHDFEGWVIFMACLALLLLEIWMLLRLSGDRRPLLDVLSIDWPAPRPDRTIVSHRRPGAPAIAAAILLLAGAAAAVALPERGEFSPERLDFSRFPMQVEGRTGHRDRIEPEFLDILDLDDYILADYVAEGATPVNFYVAYYASQRGGRSAHSPSSCLPGGGWRIASFASREIPLAGAGSLPVNRAVIEQGGQRQLVYYWFKQRHRIVTSEYLVKWYLLWDSLTRRRSDGALVRLVTPLAQGEEEDAGDRRLLGFAQAVVPRLAVHVPD